MSSTIPSIRRMGVACVVLAAACTGEPTAPRTGSQPLQQQLPALPQDVVVEPTDDELAQIAASVPGFGGMHFDGEGRLVVLLTDPSRRAGVAAAISPMLGRGPQASAALADFTVRPARYGFTQLRQWRRSLNPGVLSLPGVVFTDIDESRNRLIVAVESASKRAGVAAALKRLQLPPEAVLIEEHAPVVPAGTLREFRRPTLAGMQIAYGTVFNGPCTLGADALTWEASGHIGRDGFGYFITNSHCTNTQGGTENTLYYQPSVTGASIATEVRDPLYFTGGLCPFGRRCRRSDAALVRYHQTGTPGGFGQIARTTSVGGASGSITLSNPEFDYYAGFYGAAQPWEPPPFVGQPMDKVGRTTGWTRGTVTSTCVDQNVAGSDVTFFCQTRVSGAGADVGDSGSPAFQDRNGNPLLLGIVWARFQTGTGFVFSPLRSVEAELGTFYYCLC
jgi:hypothetical protein